MSNERKEPRILVADIETTGLEPTVHSILSIGAVWLSGGVGEFQRDCRIWEGAGLDPVALQINGCSIERCTDVELPTEAQIIREFLEWVGPEPVMLAGLNPSHDRGFIRESSKRAGMPAMKTFSHRMLDLHSLTVSFALALGADVPSEGYHTDEIYDLLKLDPEPQPHVAIVGARKEAEALQMLLGIPTCLPEMLTEDAPADNA